MRTQAQPSSRHPVLFFIVLCLGVSTLAFAQQQPTRPPRTMPRPALEQGAKPLLYELPSAVAAKSVKGPARLLTLQMSRQKAALVKETIELPSELSKGAVVAVLGSHAKELERLRRMEASRPGSLRLAVWLGDRLVDELAWKELEERQAKWAAVSASPVGFTRQVDVILGGAFGSLTGKGYEAGRDPACVQQCDDERSFCYTDRCDPRGSCQFCEEYYDDCVISCPEVCVDPKRVYNYQTSSYVGSSYSPGLQCFIGSFFDDLYRLRDDEYLVKTYERTEYCNGSYSDRLVGQQYQDHLCWELYAPNACQGATQYASC